MILVLAAMDSEITALVASLKTPEKISWLGGDYYTGLIEDRRVICAKSGVGKVFAALTTQFFIDTCKPDYLLFTGLAGALANDLDIGDTLIAADLVQHDFDATSLGVPRGKIPYSPWHYLAADPGLLETAKAYVPQRGKSLIGRLCTGDQFISFKDSADYRYLREELNGDAVEMEGAAFALVASVNRLPFLVVRTISDRADGKAGESFEAFLPKASENSLDFVRFMCRQL